ncbi:MAG: hypothetical protein JOY64_21680 [Alphaproteobacteria bacterium]|nr:hypothetical protein [Alphaproteobacteria bacterium]MBV8410254.1 hypothetical protein [Alphaproteobacteria bacterium]
MSFRGSRKLSLRPHGHRSRQGDGSWLTEDKLRATVAGTLDLTDWVDGFRLIERRTVVAKAALVP